jgi:hypothetical protein
LHQVEQKIVIAPVNAEGPVPGQNHQRDANFQTEQNVKDCANACSHRALLFPND